MKRSGIILVLVLGLIGGYRLVVAQAPTSITSCGTYSGNLILAQNISAGGDCITIGAANTTLNGNGKTITAGANAVYLYNKAQVTLTNITSAAGIMINGEDADGVRVENSHVSGISVIAADDVVITGNTFSHAYLGQEESEMERLTFTNNTVDGNGNKLVELRGSGNVPCPGGHTITGNTFISRFVCSGTCDEPMVMFVWCTANSTISDNTVTATGDAQGVRIRDGSNNNLIERNTISVNQVEGGVFAALNVTTGNEGVRPEPSGNVFRDNVITAAVGRALRFQGSDGNTFERNVFWGNDANQASSFEQVPQGDVFSYNTFYNSGSGPALAIDYYALSGSAMNFRNNIFASAGSQALRTGKFSGAYYNGDHNLFYSSSAAGVTTAGSVSAWRLAYSDDASSVFGNPVFVSAGSGNFHLQSGSAARGIGDNGNDAGAFQFNGNPPACSESWSCGAWSSCVNSSQSRTCTDANACGTTASRPPLTQSCSSGGDTTNPTISISAPTNGGSVSGITTISASADDNVGVAGVTFYVNGAALWAEDTSAPYGVQWDTAIHTNGSTKSLTAVARDAAGNTTTSAAVSVTINNGVCTESWSCGAWSGCVNGSQSRTCTDAHSCGTTSGRPPLTQSCVVQDTIAPSAISNLFPH